MASTLVPVRTSIASASNACINQLTKSGSKRGSMRSARCTIVTWAPPPRSDMRELRCDVAAPNQHDATWQPLQVEEVFVPHEVFFAQNPQFDRLCSGGDQKMTSLQGFVFDLQDIASDKTGLAVKCLNPFLLVSLLVLLRDRI